MSATTDQPALSPRRRRSAPAHRSDEDVAAGIARQIRALSRRASVADPDTALLLLPLERELAQAWQRAVAGWRASGFSDTDIGRFLGVTKQAVQQRWPRTT